MNKILLSITTLTLSAFLVTSSFANADHTSGDKVAASAPHQDGDKGADKVAGSTEGHQGGDKGADTLATVAPKSKKTNNSKAKSKNQSSK
jgi:hypothetical protein